MFDEPDFLNGKITHNDLHHIDTQKLLSDQISQLKEDMFQVRYGERLIIDIGWFPSFSTEGHFRTVVIQDFDWETPVFEKTCKDMDVLKNHLSEAIVVVSSLMEAGIK